MKILGNYLNAFADDAVGRRCIENCGPSTELIVFVSGVIAALSIFSIWHWRKYGKEKSPYGLFSNWEWAVPYGQGFSDLVELNLSLNGRETLRLNGNEVASRFVIALKSEYRFRLSDLREAELQVRADWKRFGLPKCALIVAGETIQPRKGGVSFSTDSAIEPLPKWYWIFGTLCFSIPIISRGGALPAFIGIWSAAACAKVVRLKSWEMTAKVVACIGITLVAWSSLVLLAVVIARLK